MSARLVHADDSIRIYEGRADTWDGGEPIDLVFTNPYGPLPASLRNTPTIVHQWCHRLDELKAWCGGVDLTLMSWWNNDREAFWVANMPMQLVDVRDFKPEPGGWYPEAMVRRILTAYDPGTRPFTVFDGFMGRGTVAMITRKLGMQYVGVEELPKHIALAKEYLGLAP